MLKWPAFTNGMNAAHKLAQSIQMIQVGQFRCPSTMALIKGKTVAGKIKQAVGLPCISLLQV